MNKLTFCDMFFFTKVLPMEETLFQLPCEAQRIPHVCLCHWLSKFCRNSLLAVYLGCPAPLAGMPPFALAANTALVKT